MDHFTKYAMRALQELANRIAEDARQNADWSNDIPKAISLGILNVKGEGTCSIDITVDLKVAPMARAFEFGSGLHATKADPEKYKIAPKKDDGALKFPIERWPNYEPPPNVRFAVFPGAISLKPYVMHPGVEARPYLQPAVNVQLSKEKGRFSRLIKRGILEHLSVRFREAKQ